MSHRKLLIFVMISTNLLAGWCRWSGVYHYIVMLLPVLSLTQWERSIKSVSRTEQIALYSVFVCMWTVSPSIFLFFCVFQPSLPLSFLPPSTTTLVVLYISLPPLMLTHRHTQFVLANGGRGNGVVTGGQTTGWEKSERDSWKWQL